MARSPVLAIAGLLFFVSRTATAQEVPPFALAAQAWTGSLLAPSAPVHSQGGIGIESFLLDKHNAGTFDNNGLLHALSTASDGMRWINSLQYGVTDRLSLQLIPSFDHQLNGGAMGIADLPVRLKYRWVDEGDEIWQPAVITVAGITLPIGPYQRLASSSDGFGNGDYSATGQLLLQSLFSLLGHPSRMRAWMTLTVPLDSAALHGITAYGTPPGFTGWAVPGRAGEIGIADEFAIDSHWVFALDAVEDLSKSTHLYDAADPVPPVDLTGASFSLAPAIELNLSRQVGFIAGVEFALAGRNTAAAVVPQIALNLFL